MYSWARSHGHARVRPPGTAAAQWRRATLARSHRRARKGTSRSSPVGTPEEEGGPEPDGPSPLPRTPHLGPHPSEETLATGTRGVLVTMRRPLGVGAAVPPRGDAGTAPPLDHDQNVRSNARLRMRRNTYSGMYQRQCSGRAPMLGDHAAAESDVSVSLLRPVTAPARVSSGRSRACRSTHAAICVREEKPSLARMLATCLATVA